MPIFRTHFPHGLSALTLALGLVSGCAEERAPINRVQPNAVEKSFFVGAKLSDASDNPEFYYRPTVVDVDYGASQDGMFTASHAQTLARVGFEVTEDLLVARLTYERVPGTSGLGAATDNTGQIVAAFKIDSHFDVRRAYNPQTGEELNIVEENDSDRPWYAREFMHVDWSQNLITSAYELDTLASLKAYADNAVEYEPAAYSVEDPSNPDAPAFSAADGYFDVTNKVFAKPQMVETPYGTFPACFFNADFFQGSGPIANCNPVELKIRLAFKKVVDRGYEPVDWDGARMAAFGAFTTGTLTPNRFGYDRELGVVDDKWFRFAARHNIWMESHVDGGHVEKGKECKGDDVCDTQAGSHCDVFRGACTLPLREREIRPIVYYYGPNSDPTLFDSVAKVAQDWDSALRHAVQTGRYAECVNENGGPINADALAGCKADYPTDQAAAMSAVGPILSFCHNPVSADDPKVCGPAGTLARIGDLRYSMANVIQSPQVPSPWGILADAVDPTTGEVVASSVNVWNAVTDLATRRTIDLMRWYLGELSSIDLIAGRYSQAVNLVARPGTQPAWRGPTPMNRAEADARLGAMDRSLFDPKLAVGSLPTGGSRVVVDWALAKTRENFGNDILGQGNAPLQARLNTLRGSPLEATLTNKSFLSLVGMNADAPLDQRTLDKASPLRGGFWQNRGALERQRQLALAQQGHCVMEAAEPVGAIELAAKLVNKFPVTDLYPDTPALEIDAAELAKRNGKWGDYVRKRLTRGVMAHEMGHSMGLRHVFTSSFDALNHRPQYWQLRTRDKQETTLCAGPVSDGSTCIGPRYKDPVTTAERDGMLTTWQQTSVMDYPGDITQEMLDIGAYDRAAIRFIYGEVADVWDEAGKSCPPGAMGQPTCTADGALLADQLDTFGGITGAWYGTSASLDDAIHYSELDQRLNLIRNCRPADTSPPANWDVEQDGVYDPVLDGGIVNGTVCDGIPTDYVRYNDLQAVPTSNDGMVRKFDASGRVRRPYMFASDEYADIGNVAVYRDDNGSDAYEVASYFINEFEDRHIFDNHRRGRTTFTYSGAFMRSYSRYNQKLKELSKGWALLSDIFAGSQALGVADLVDGPAADGLSRPHALATSLVFDHFTRMLTRPTSGDHYFDQRPDAVGKRLVRSTDQALIIDSPPDRAARMIVPEGTQNPGIFPAIGGRPLHNALDGTKGYYATDYDLWVGSYYDKTLAMDLLLDSTDRFISQSRDDFVDGRYRNVSLTTLYPEGVRRLVATALTHDYDLLGFRVPSNGNKLILDPSLQPINPLGFRMWWPKDGPAMCWPAPGQLSCGPASSGSETVPTPPDSVAIDPEVGFEVQKFVALFALLYLPDSWKRDWVDNMRIFQVGTDPNPSFAATEAVAFTDPISGQRFLARNYGKEMLGDREVQRGIAARVLEWANTLASHAYQVKSVNPTTGELTFVTYADDSNCPVGYSACAGTPVQIDVTYSAKLRNYKTVIDYVRTLTAELGFYGPSWRGVYR